jgi:glycosyltransferase involved in cell wall biosynthesis
VVIPTRNRWRRLETTLASALGQVAVDLEVIVVDDGSTDETPERLHAVDDPRVRTVRHESSQGVARARNHGIAVAEGAWVALLDDDDIWAPAKLRAQLDAATAADAGFAYTGAVYLDERRRVIWVEPAPDPERIAHLLTQLNAVPAGCSNVIARTDLLRRLGGFDEQLFQLTDWDLWIRLAEASSAAAVPELLVGYLKHSSNMLTDKEHDILRELRYIEEKHRTDMRMAGINLSHWAGLNHLMAGRRREAATTYIRGARLYRCRRHWLKAMRAALWPNPYRRDDHLAGREWPRPEWLDGP